MAKTKGPDWNPRTLSTFSTFGGFGPPSPESLHGDRSDEEVPYTLPRCVANGDVRFSGDEPDVKHKRALAQNGPLLKPRPEGRAKRDVPRGIASPVALFHPGEASSRSSGSSAASGASSIPEVLAPPEIVAPMYKEGIEGTPPFRIKATRVAPPIPPSHAYSKSLVAEDRSPVTPCHGYSRSIGNSEGGTNFKNGIGEISLFLGPRDRLFGFSVVGGSDERIPARIDEIAPGSPADKADLEVGDEILEVNGKSLEDATHTEVISHIHQCIRSRTICLRVKRRTGNKLAADLAASSNVQDAFVIAVEQRARERLERLSALKKIKPVDMTKLSTQLSETTQQQQQPTPEPQERHQHLPEAGVSVPPESSPIYVTSVPNLTSSSAPSTRTRSRSSTPGSISSSSPRHRPPSSSSDTGVGPPPLRKRSSGAPAPEGGDKSGDELELTHDLDFDRDEAESRSEEDLDEDDVSESGDSFPATPEKTYGLGARPRPGREAPREVLLDSKNHVTERPRSPLEYTTSLDSNSSRKSGGSGSSSGGTAPSKPLASSRSSSSYVPDRGFKGEIERVGDPQETMISMVEFDPANKEMAVDVPDSFVGRTKTPPRYPPPKPQVTGGFNSSIPNNNNNSSSSKGSSRRGASLSSGTVTPVNGTLSKTVMSPMVPDQYQTMRQDVVVHSPNSQEEVDKLKRYEEEIKQRREREEEMAELQRSSIRGSQKLQALASYPHGHPQVHSPPNNQPLPTGVVNQAYDQEDPSDSENKGSSPSINELIQSLQRIQNVLKSNGHRISEDMNLVAQLLVNPEFQKVLAVHNKVQETWCLNRPPTPLTFKAQELVNECMDVLNGSTAPEALELAEVLTKYPVEGLFYAHDRIADSEPPLETAGTEHSVDLPPPKEAVTERPSTSFPEENVRIVRIDKTNEPLGATIRNEGDAVVIGRIVQGGAAEKCGRLQEGDEILEVNGAEVRGKSVNDVCDMLAGMTGTLTFIISPSTHLPTPVSPSLPVHAMHVKAYFDYDPEEDLYIPCRELGMSFQKGDILHVMNQQDPNWWQAYRDGEEDQSLAGLIPSKAFQQQREAMRQTVVGDTTSKEKSKKGKLLCAKKHQKKKKKKMLYPNYNEDFDAEEILTYEEVALYFPRANRKRPIVLIGPPNIGRHELRQKLMEDTDKFAAAVPHTSRPKRDREVDGQDYHFISRTQFEADILARKFVEHGEFEKAYYGTSLDAIRAVVNSGKICVLNLHPLSLKMLKNSDLMPYVVLIAPPSLEKLRQKKQKIGEPFKEDDLKETIQKAREMEDQYGHYFDLVLINQDVERTYQQLIHEINVLEREPQWVPAAWLANER